MARCEFTEQDLMLRDTIVFGIKNDAIKERLLRESKLTSIKTLDICQATETSRQQMKAMTNASQSQVRVDYVKSNPRSKKSVQSQRPGQTNQLKEKPDVKLKACTYCGRRHTPPPHTHTHKCPVSKVCKMRQPKSFCHGMQRGRIQFQANRTAQQ